MNLVDVRLSMGVRVLCRPSVWEASITHLCAGLSGSPWLGWLHFRGQTWFQSISHRIHGAGIYTNIGAILMVNVTIYSSTMDPMGLELSPGSGWPSCHETEVDLWGDESRSQKWLVRLVWLVWLVWHGIDFGIVGYNMLHRLLYICYNESFCH